MNANFQPDAFPDARGYFGAYGGRLVPETLMSALVGLLVANFPRHSASDGVVIGIVCFGVTLVMSFRARARDTKRGGGHVRLAHGEYQEAQAGAYQSMDQEAEAGTSQSMDIGCLLLTYAFVIAVGVMAVGALAVESDSSCSSESLLSRGLTAPRSATQWPERARR